MRRFMFRIPFYPNLAMASSEKDISSQRIKVALSTPVWAESWSSPLMVKSPPAKYCSVVPGEQLYATHLSTLLHLNCNSRSRDHSWPKVYLPSSVFRSWHGRQLQRRRKKGWEASLSCIENPLFKSKRLSPNTRNKHWSAERQPCTYSP